jgi:CYTH domain-containing protein
VMKLRSHVVEGGFTFEVDRFLNRDLLLAEVEVPDVDSIVVLPEWLQSCVIREVTDELEFEGVNLAR